MSADRLAQLIDPAPLWPVTVTGRDDWWTARCASRACPRRHLIAEGLTRAPVEQAADAHLKELNRRRHA